VTARLETGRLRVVAGTCPNLLYEAALYRYGLEAGAGGSETPLDEHNHAPSACHERLPRVAGAHFAASPCSDSCCAVQIERLPQCQGYWGAGRRSLNRHVDRNTHVWQGIALICCARAGRPGRGLDHNSREHTSTPSPPTPLSR